MHGGERIRLSDDVAAIWDKEYNVIRAFTGSYPDLNTINFWLSDDQATISRIADLRGGPDAATLDKLQSVGLLTTAALDVLNVSSDEIEVSRVSNVSVEHALSRMQQDDVNQLASQWQYQGTSGNTGTVLQGQGRFITADGSTNGLHTFGAGPCLVLIAVSKDANGNVVNVGMAHIDGITPKESIMGFLDQARANTEDVTVSIISGERETALKTYDAVQDFGAEITFAHIDLASQRSDAVSVDKQGNIYYGPRQDFLSVDPKDMARVRARVMSLGAQPLSLEKLP